MPITLSPHFSFKLLVCSVIDCFCCCCGSCCCFCCLVVVVIAVIVALHFFSFIATLTCDSGVCGGDMYVTDTLDWNGGSLVGNGTYK